MCMWLKPLYNVKNLGTIVMVRIKLTLIGFKTIRQKSHYEKKKQVKNFNINS